MAPITWACPVMVQSGPVTWAQAILSWRQSLGLVPWLDARAHLDPARASASRSPQDKMRSYPIIFEFEFESSFKNKMRSYPPIPDSNLNSNPDYSMIGMRLGISINRNPRAYMASQPIDHPSQKLSHSKTIEVWPKIQERKKREKSSPEPDSRSNSGVLMCWEPHRS